MALTYTPIATTTLGSAVTSYTFSSIPSTYTDLVLICNISTPSLSAITMQVNGDTASNYSSTVLSGNGTSAQSARTTSDTSMWVGDYYVNTYTDPTTVIVNCQNYANTTTYKTFLGRAAVKGSSTNGETVANVSLWRSTAAVNSITLKSYTGNFATGSTFTLYGIAAA